MTWFTEDYYVDICTIQNFDYGIQNGELCPLMRSWFTGKWFLLQVHSHSGCCMKRGVLAYDFVYKKASSRLFKRSKLVAALSQANVKMQGNF